MPSWPLAVAHGWRWGAERCLRPSGEQTLVEFSNPASFLAVDGSCRKLQTREERGLGAQTDDWVTTTPPVAACQTCCGSSQLARAPLKGGSRKKLGCWCCYQPRPSGPPIWEMRLLQGRDTHLLPSQALRRHRFQPQGFEPGQHRWGCYFGWFQIN